MMVAYWEQILNGLYFPQELPVAPARRDLFDLVTTAQLADVTKLPVPARLKALRTKFEEVYGIEHPFRAALFSFGNLDTVRIIEGRA